MDFIQKDGSTTTPIIIFGLEDYGQFVSTQPETNLFKGKGLAVFHQHCTAKEKKALLVFNTPESIDRLIKDLQNLKENNVRSL
jgi:hypothetical protein